MWPRALWAENLPGEQSAQKVGFWRQTSQVTPRVWAGGRHQGESSDSRAMLPGFDAQLLPCHLGNPGRGLCLSSSVKWRQLQSKRAVSRLSHDRMCKAQTSAWLAQAGGCFRTAVGESLLCTLITTIVFVITNTTSSRGRRFSIISSYQEWLPRWPSGKRNYQQCRRPRFDSFSGTSPGAGNGKPL